MSDIEDGEVLSSDNEDGGEEECKLKESSEGKNKLYDDNNNSLENSDYSRWNFDQNNNNRHKSIDRDRKRFYKFPENFDDRKRRKSDDLNTDEILSDISINKSNVHLSKRRILCKYYAAGECKNGRMCAFMHQDFPCKFYHHEGSTCRAGNNCKYSHEPLSDEMKIVLDGFIHDGKEKMNNNYNTLSSNNEFFKDNNTSIRPNCLLPTPTFIQSTLVSGYEPDSNDPYNSYSYDNIQKFQEENHYSDNLNSFLDKIVVNGDLPNYPIANKSNFIQKYLSKSQSHEFSHVNQNSPQRHQSNIMIDFSNYRNTERSPYFQTQLESIVNSKTYFESKNNHFEQQFSMPNEENVIPNVFEEKVNPNKIISHNHSNYKNHAPARFIVGNFDNSIKTEPETTVFDNDFKVALKKLAEQVVTVPNQRSPSLETNVENVSKEEILHENTESYISKDIIKTEASDVRIDDNISIFKPEVDMSESEKMYIEEMKSFINLNAHFENTIPWEIKKLHLVTKQPYTLFKLNIDNIHDNPMADPRLSGHPVLNFAVKNGQNSKVISDDEEDVPLSTDDKEDEVENSENSRSYLSGNLYRIKKIV